MNNKLLSRVYQFYIDILCAVSVSHRIKLMEWVRSSLKSKLFILCYVIAIIYFLKSLVYLISYFYIIDENINSKVRFTRNNGKY